jgi:hypothetical protein
VDSFEKAVQVLRRHKRTQTSFAWSFLILGLLLIALGAWGEHSTNERISEAIKAFYDSPILAIAAISSTPASIVTARFNLFAGIWFTAIGCALFFRKDAKAVVLLKLVDHLGLSGERDENPNRKRNA